jgi:hypothetical protein
VHEAYLRLMGQTPKVYDRAHFFAVASRLTLHLFARSGSTFLPVRTVRRFGWLVAEGNFGE